ncbi:uncharacterized protein LOC8062336 [Sorghum bicolor]|uniref:uncharacterized protein LOC8062336 n=1 Tax=Sorghum bicolor TaxID=4558 RepID=UPI000B423F0C|nr:uncharacterized protein LOC8062336 [Sorghum bicolor]|eukprot:XP_021312028.1 uncharacterized protein LOC8062336 [Sorghum bicolor]
MFIGKKLAYFFAERLFVWLSAKGISKKYLLYPHPAPRAPNPNPLPPAHTRPTRRRWTLCTAAADQIRRRRPTPSPPLPGPVRHRRLPARPPWPCTAAAAPHWNPRLRHWLRLQGPVRRRCGPRSHPARLRSRVSHLPVQVLRCHWVCGQRRRRGVLSGLMGSNSCLADLFSQLLETLIKNCGDFVHMQVAEKDILHEMPDYHVKEKILILIDTWQEAFGGACARYPQYYATYQEMLYPNT